MKLKIIPKENITISTTKTNEEIVAILAKRFEHSNRGNTKFAYASNGFAIERTLQNSSGTYLVANATILNGTKINFIRLDITAKDTSLIFFTIFWYTINLSIFLLLVYLSIVNQEFEFSIFIPLLFIFLGYGFTTAMVQGGMDELIGEVKDAVK